MEVEAWPELRSESGGSDARYVRERQPNINGVNGLLCLPRDEMRQIGSAQFGILLKAATSNIPVWSRSPRVALVASSDENGQGESLHQNKAGVV